MAGFNKNPQHFAGQYFLKNIMMMCVHLERNTRIRPGLKASLCAFKEKHQLHIIQVNFNEETLLF